MNSDISSREDIKKLVNRFYERMLGDDELGPIFQDTKLTEHLPILYDFWESVLFRAGKYKRNTMEKHLDLHQRYPLKKKHFDQWLALFNQTVDDLFQGEKAKEAKERALSIATIIKLKIDQLEK